MCESRVVLVSGAKAESVMEEAMRVEQSGNDVVCVAANGSRTVVYSARIVRADLGGHIVELVQA